MMELAFLFVSKTTDVGHIWMPLSLAGDLNCIVAETVVFPLAPARLLS